MVSLGAQLPLDEAREQMQGTRAKSFTVTTSMPPLNPEAQIVEKYGQKHKTH